MANSPLLGYAELAESQALPATTVNLIDRYLEAMATRAIVLDKDHTDPTTATTSEGSMYIVATGATGAWSGWSDRLALMAGGTWRPILPREGLRAYVVDEDTDYEYDGTDWVVVAGLGTPDLDDLTDVNAPTPSNGDVLTWDSTPGEWVASAPTSPITELDDVPDVNAPTPSNGDVLTWDSTPGEWVAQALPGAGAFVLDDATDVDTTGVADGDVLTFDSGSGDWVAAAPSGGGSDWTDLTFTGGSASKWGSTTFISDQSITLAGIDKIEIVAAFDRDSGEETCLFISPDTNTCYQSKIQTDNNWVLYRYSTSGGSSTTLSGGTVSQARAGSHELRFVIHLGKSGSSNRITAVANTFNTKEATDAVSNVNLIGSANRVYLTIPNDSTGNIIYCKYRINSPSGI